MDLRHYPKGYLPGTICPREFEPPHASQAYVEQHFAGISDVEEGVGKLALMPPTATPMLPTRTA